MTHSSAVTPLTSLVITRYLPSCWLQWLYSLCIFFFKHFLFLRSCLLANQTNTTIVCCLICTDQRDKQGYKVLEVKAIIFVFIAWSCTNLFMFNRHRQLAQKRSNMKNNNLRFQVWLLLSKTQRNIQSLCISFQASDHTVDEVSIYLCALSGINFLSF